MLKLTPLICIIKTVHSVAENRKLLLNVVVPQTGMLLCTIFLACIRCSTWILTSSKYLQPIILYGEWWLKWVALCITLRAMWQAPAQANQSPTRLAYLIINTLGRTLWE